MTIRNEGGDYKRNTFYCEVGWKVKEQRVVILMLDTKTKATEVAL